MKKKREYGIRTSHSDPRASGKYNEITSFLYLLKMTPFHLDLVMVFLEPLLQRPQGNDQIWSSVLLILPHLLQSFATVFSWLEKKENQM